MDWIQVFIFLFSSTAIWLVGRKEHWMRWGYIAGLCSQPFWFYSSWHNEQWGIFALAIWYTLAWLQGIRNYWIKGTDETS